MAYSLWLSTAFTITHASKTGRGRKWTNYNFTSTFWHLEARDKNRGEGYVGENKSLLHFFFRRDEDHLVIHRTPATFIMVTCCGLYLSGEEVSLSISLAC